MKITKDCMVTLEYTLKDSTQTVLDSSEKMGPLDYIHGYNMLIPGLERALENREDGDSFAVTVEPRDGFGEIDENAVIKAQRSDFPDDVELMPGMEFEMSNTLVSIKEIDGDTVIIDANHPLAGETLYFDIAIKGVREALPEEIEAALAPITHCGCDCGHDHDGGCGGCSGCH